jgi:hypothetical protein
VRAIHRALLDYLRDKEIRDGPQPRGLASSRAQGRSYRPTSVSISSLRTEEEQIVGVDELAPGDVRWFRGALKTSCLETESQHIGIRAWIAEDHHNACF